MDKKATLSQGSHYLQQIRAAIRAKPVRPTNTHQLEILWEDYLRQVHRRLPRATIQAKGQILHTGKLSPGCRACKAGEWDCVFITHQCNLTCRFCTLPQNMPKDYQGAAYGSTPETFIEHIGHTTIRGVGFTGGEALLYPDRLCRWIKAIKNERPDLYLWVYTNGLLATRDRLAFLRQLGVDEVRFNMAATGYDHPLVLGHLRHAARLFPAVTVEIPALPDDAARLLNGLALWVSAGARFLNLHELMREPDSPSRQLPGDFFTWVTPDGHRTDLHLKSRSLVLSVMEKVMDEEMPLWVNDCSSQSKLRQIIERRRRLLPLVHKPYEKCENGHFLSHVCVLYPNDTADLIHPDALDKFRPREKNCRFYSIQRTLPLSVGERPCWTQLTGTCPK